MGKAHTRPAPRTAGTDVGGPVQKVPDIHTEADWAVMTQEREVWEAPGPEFIRQVLHRQVRPLPRRRHCVDAWPREENATAPQAQHDIWIRLRSRNSHNSSLRHEFRRGMSVTTESRGDAGKKQMWAASRLRSHQEHQEVRSERRSRIKPSRWSTVRYRRLGTNSSVCSVGAPTLGGSRPNQARRRRGNHRCRLILHRAFFKWGEPLCSVRPLCRGRPPRPQGGA